MSDFKILNRSQIRDAMVADLVNNIAGAVARGAGDDLWDLAEAEAGTLVEAYAALAKAADESWPQHASFAGLVKHAAPLIGRPLAATPAELSVVVTGTDGSTWTMSDALVHVATGLRYLPTAPGTIAGETTLTARCTVGGGSTALGDGTALQWESAPTGINPPAVTTGDPDGGTDAESQAKYLARYLALRANPNGGGRAVDFERWALAVTGVGRATALPLRRGLGSIDVAVLDREGEAVSDEVLIAVQTALDENRPVCCKDCQAVKPTLVDVDLEFELYLAAGYEFSDAPDTNVTGGTTTSVKVGDTTGWKAGQWVALRDLRQARQVQSVPDGTTLVVTASWLDSFGRPTAPTSGDLAVAGCPTYDDLSAAIAAYFDELGTGGSYYHAKALGRLTNRYEVLNASQTDPAGDVAAIIDPDHVEHLRLGELVLRSA